MSDFTRISRFLAEQTDRMIDLQRRLTAVAALGPDSGGQGEWDKAEELKRWLSENGFPTVEEYPATDSRVTRGIRPNFLVRFPGADHSRTAWIITHLDVVPPGDLALWNSDPWTLKVDGNRLYGRGTEDNQQGLVSSIFALDALIRLGITPAVDVALLFVADEETGSEYGLDYLAGSFDLFHPNDIIVIPDAGNEDGTLLEIAEKTILWLRFTTIGKQTHASRPEGGNNAFRAASYLVTELDAFFKKYTAVNPVFDPPYSTFEPTMKEANVPNINTLPGRDVFCYDCRILPSENVDQILAGIKDRSQAIERRFGVSISHDIVQKTISAPPTPLDSTVVRCLTRAIKDVYGVQARPTGIGGGTVANYLRLKAIPVAVWSRHDKVAHQPNEYCLLENLVGDARVFAHVFMAGGE